MIAPTTRTPIWLSATRLCTISAGLLIGASAALGTYFGYQTGAHHHVTLGLIFAGAALGGELLKPFAIAGAIEAFRRWDILRGAACVAVGLVCITYSLASELALSAGSRGDLAAKREAQADTAEAAKEKRKRATTELSTLKASRPTGELVALIERERGRGCAAENGTGKWVCPRAAALHAELGRAKRKTELEATIAAAEKALDTPTETVKHADPLASAVAHYMTAAGRKTEAEDLATWLYLLPVLFLELGSAFGLVVAGTVRAVGAGQQQELCGETEHQGLFTTPLAQQADEPANSGHARPVRSLGTPSNTPARERLLALVRDAKGPLRTGHRALGEALGVSATRAGQLLRDLAQVGAIRVRASKTGSVVALVRVQAAE